jgi:hypothetical protein
MMMVKGRLINVRMIVKIPSLTFPASGTEYVPDGPRLDDPPTKMTEAIDTSDTKINDGTAPKDISVIQSIIALPTHPCTDLPNLLAS